MRVFISAELEYSDEVRSYASEFKKVKSDDHYISKILGEDRDYSQPPNAKLAELRHIHLLSLNSKGRTSDRFLVYCPSYNNPDDYLLLDILEPGHEQSRKPGVMARLVQIAEQFRNKY